MTRKTRFFEESDVSDIENELLYKDIEEPKPDTSVKDIRKLKDSLERLETELARCHTGTSKLRKGSVQKKSTTPTYSSIERVRTGISRESIEKLIEVLEQDFGYIVARWAAEEVFHIHHPELPKFFSNKHK